MKKGIRLDLIFGMLFLLMLFGFVFYPIWKIYNVTGTMILFKNIMPPLVFAGIVSIMLIALRGDKE